MGPGRGHTLAAGSLTGAPPPEPGPSERKDNRRVIAVGMMSGTSGDGINLAAIEIEPGARPSVRIVATAERAYAKSLREAVLRAGADVPFALSDIARLHAELGDAYAAAASEFVATLPRRPDVIALHGQTVAHLPAEHTTLQIGDASRVARATGLPTVSDFRSADMAAGGEGAPLGPFGDHVLSASRAPIAVLNLGGIANLTLIPTASANDVIAFDTGPANMTSDAIVAPSGEAFDRDGRRARAGRVNERALEEALRHPYFARRAPKSTGREEFGKPFATRIQERVSADGGSLDDARARPCEAAWCIFLERHRRRDRRGRVENARVRRRSRRDRRGARRGRWRQPAHLARPPGRDRGRARGSARRARSRCDRALVRGRRSRDRARA